MQIDQLVAELLARGDMSDDTVADLNRQLEAWRAGTLDPDDDAYLRALHARIFETPVTETEMVAVGAPRLDGLSIDEWRDRALKAEARLAEIEDT
ncbi:MAG: hypothetical protein ABL879_16700 [Devosia sp.]